MTEAKGQPEPSMEEILASIRRIISEDGDADAAAPAPPPAVQKPAAPTPAEDDGEPAIELTEMVDDDGSVVSLSGVSAESPVEVAAQPSAELEPEPVEEMLAEVVDLPEGLELPSVEDEPAEEAFELPPVVAPSAADLTSTELTEEPPLELQSMDELPSELGSEPPVAAEPDLEPEPDFSPEVAEEPAFEPEPVVEEAAFDEPMVSAEPEPVEPAPVAAESVAPVAATPEPEVSLEDLVSSTARSSSAAAFAQLAQAVNEKEIELAPTPEPVSISGKSLDAMVAEMIRPMLKEWLDQNLPAIVERMVQKEIKRMTSGT